MLTPSLSTIDLVVIVAYLVLVIFIGLRMARRTHSGEDLFLAGRRLGWVPIGFSLFASNISSTTLVGSCMVAYLSFGQLDFSWANVVDATPADKLSLMLPLDDPNLPWLGTLVGVPILGFYFWCTNQFIVQRVLGARSIAHARWGVLFAGFLKLPVLYIMVLPGVMAGVFLPELENGDAVFPALVTTLLPAGLVGLVMAGLMAAIMSSIDSTLNSASALLTMDFLRPERRGWSAKRVVWTGRGFILLFMFLAALISPMVASFPGLFHYLQSALAYLVPPVAVVFMLGLFWRRASATGALATLLGGHLVSALLFIFSLTDLLSLHFTIVAGLLALISSVIFVIASLLSDPPTRDQVRCFTFSTDTTKRQPELARWQDYRIYSLILVTLATVLVIVHW